MTQLAFWTDPLSPELNHLMNDYPRDAWDAHPNFARSTQNWLGGHCAYAMSKGYIAPTVPEAWTIYEDRLYLNFTLRARELWLQDVPGNIALGDANWPKLRE